MNGTGDVRCIVDAVHAVQIQGNCAQFNCQSDLEMFSEALDCLYRPIVAIMWLWEPEATMNNLVCV